MAYRDAIDANPEDMHLEKLGGRGGLNETNEFKIIKRLKKLKRS